MRFKKTTFVVIGLMVVTGVAIFIMTKTNNKNFTEGSQTAFTDSTIRNTTNWTVQDWVSWRDSQIAKIMTPTFDANGEKLILREDVIAKCYDAYNFLEPYLSDSNFLSDSARGKELTNFVSFVKAQHWMNIKDSTGKFTHALGTEISDKEYWNYISANVEFPDLLKSQQFLNLMSNPDTYKAAIDLINNNNSTLPNNRKWIVYPFRAQFIKSVDKTTYGRMLVLIPNDPTPDGQTIDKWVLFSIATPDLNPIPEVKSVSIISIKQSNNASEKSKAYLADFMREKDPATGNITIVPNYTMEKDPSKNCYDCHKSAIISIHPEQEFTFDQQNKMIANATIGSTPATVNRLISRYGNSDFGPLKPESYGPSMGRDDIERTTQFIATVTKEMNLDPSSYPKIINSMDCASCHNDFAKLNYLQAVRSNRDVKAFEARKGMIQTFIEKGWMPPRNTLSNQERLALWKCLMTEYFDPNTNSGQFINWLKGK